jgi:hypothetical protein
MVGQKVHGGNDSCAGTQMPPAKFAHPTFTQHNILATLSSSSFPAFSCHFAALHIKPLPAKCLLAQYKIRIDKETIRRAYSVRDETFIDGMIAESQPMQSRHRELLHKGALTSNAVVGLRRPRLLFVMPVKVYLT